METEIEIIEHEGQTIATIIYCNYRIDGVKFFTPGSFSQQLAFMGHKAGKIIRAHTHNAVKREISLTQEVLVIKKGRIQVNFYDQKQNHFDSRILGAGDIILLSGGGHGFKVLEDLEMVEIKQGPYLNDGDKTCFDGIEL